MTLARLYLLGLLLASPLLQAASEHDNAMAREAANEARAAYEKAQALKREHRFAEAQQEFEYVADLNEPGTHKWASLAADELDYGLLLYEAKYWTLKMGSGVNDGRTMQTYLRNAEKAYRQILELNSDNVERTREIQGKLDDLLISTQALRNAARAQSYASLERLRIIMDTYYMENGDWPDQRTLAKALKETLKLNRQKESRYLIKNYWKSKNGYYAVLMDTEGGANIKLKGDINGSRLSPMNP